jgi:hypothetical protein
VILGFAKFGGESQYHFCFIAKISLCP